MAGRRYNSDNRNPSENRRSSTGSRPGNARSAGRQSSTGKRSSESVQRGNTGNRNNREYQDGYAYRSRNNAEGRSGRPPQFEDVSSYSDGSDYKNARKGPKKTHRKLKVVLIAFCALILVLGGIVIFASTYLLGGITSEPISKNNKDLGIPSDNVYETQAAGTVTNYALFGTDDRDDATDSRSDAVMVLSVDTKHNKIKLISILRDSYVSINGSMDKLNHAYAYGGPELAVRTLNENFGLNIKDYATVNFTKLAKIVDAFGGTAVTISDEEMDQINQNMRALAETDIDPDVTIIDSDYMTQSGEVLLNGNQAVAYSRIRYLSGGDNARAVRQQNVIKGMLGRLKNLGASEYVTLIRTVAPITVTSVDVGDVIPMIPFAMGGFTMETYSIPSDAENAGGIWVDDVWYYGYDLALATEHIDAIIRETDSPHYSTYFDAAS